MPIAKDVAARPREWLCDGLIPKGRVTLVAGWRGIGKGLFIIWLTARLTTAEEPVKVWIQSYAEDDLAEDLRPRLEIAGADLAMVQITDQQYRFPKDLSRFAADIAQSGAKVVFIDSLQTHIANMSSSAENQTMTDLRAMAEDLGVAIVVVHHLIKGITSRTPVMAAIGGSGAIQNRAKVIYLVGNQPGDDPASKELRELRAKLLGNDPADEDRRDQVVVACERGWAGLKPSLSFAKVIGSYVPTQADEMYLEFIEEVTFTSQEVLSATAEHLKNRSNPEDSAVQIAARWILEVLAAEPLRMMTVNRLVEMARSDGVWSNKSAFDRARHKAGVTNIHPGRLAKYMSPEQYADLTDYDKDSYWVAF